MKQAVEELYRSISHAIHLNRQHKTNDSISSVDATCLTLPANFTFTSRVLIIPQGTFFSKFETNPCDINTISLLLVMDILCFLDGELVIRLSFHTMLTSGRLRIDISTETVLSSRDERIGMSSFESL